MVKTLIDIKDGLVEEARRATGVKKKVDLVNMALERLVRQKEIEKILEFKGKVNWEGDLERSRKERR